jgi:hypothetical protein
MALYNGTVVLTGMISTTDTTDKYPTHEDTLGKGGYRSVPTYNDLQNIPDLRRKIGMLCYIENEENIYILSKSGIWEPFNSSSTGTGSSSWNYTQMDPLELNNMFNETLNIGVTDGSI